MGAQTYDSARVHDWMIGLHAQRLPIVDIIKGLSEKLTDIGIPLFRVSTALSSLHPQLRGRQVFWERDGETKVVLRPHDIIYTDAYLKSPAKVIHDGQPHLRQRLDVPDEDIPFSILVDLKKAGATDYFIMPIPFSGGKVCFISWSTDAPDGFDDNAIDVFLGLTPLLSLVCELEVTRFSSETMLTTYLGPSAASQVLEGNVQRGHGKQIEASIWYSDLRNFTGISDKYSSADTIGLLNDYFEITGNAISENQGEILKFIGDGLLAIFPIDQETTASIACARALAAADQAIGAVEKRNVERVGYDLPPIAFGIALNVGEVMFGNIGAVDRLDFTVIGPPVNEASRIEGLCSELKQPVLTSAAFAEAAADASLTPLGRHPLKGVPEPAEIFAPAASE